MTTAPEESTPDPKDAPEESAAYLLHRHLLERIEYYHMEYGITPVEVIGVLELLKSHAVAEMTGVVHSTDLIDLDEEDIEHEDDHEEG